MRSLLCLSSLLLLAIPTGGLNLPPGWWCGDKPCPARSKETRASHGDHTTAANVTTNNTTHATTPHNPQVVWWAWWCLTQPCLPRRKETRDNDAYNTAVANIAIKNTTTHPTIAGHGPQRGPNNWWCGTHPCGATSKERRDIRTHNTTTNTTVPDNDPQRGWFCHSRICPPKLKMIKNRETNGLALNSTTTNFTASNQAGHRRITPAIVWWCSIHVCPSSMKNVERRETDILASGASKSL